MAEYVWIDGSNGVRSKSKVSILQLSDPSTRSLAASTAALTPTLRPQISPSLRLEVFLASRNNWLRCACAIHNLERPQGYWCRERGGAACVTHVAPIAPSAGSFGVPYLYRATPPPPATATTGRVGGRDLHGPVTSLPIPFYPRHSLAAMHGMTY